MDLLKTENRYRLSISRPVAVRRHRSEEVKVKSITVSIVLVVILPYS